MQKRENFVENICGNIKLKTKNISIIWASFGAIIFAIQMAI